MFGIITKGFIKRIHECFDELRYTKKDKVDYEEFVFQAVSTMNCCQSIVDIKKALYYANYCVKHWTLIEKMFEKKLDIFNSIEYSGNDTIHLNEDDNCSGILTTNFFNGIDGNLMVSYNDIDGKTNIRSLNIYNDGKIKLDNKSKYYATFSKRDFNTAKIYNSNNELLFNFVIDDNCSIFLENNVSKYDTINTEDGLYICTKEYSKTIQPGESIDFEKMLGEIQWDTIYKTNTKGVSVFYPFVDNLDEDSINLFILMSALTYLLLEHSYLENKKQEKRRVLFNSALVTTTMRNIRR